MAWLDNIGLGQLWDRISAIFARKTEAGGSFTFAGGILSLIAVAGGTLDSENLDSRYPTKDEAAASLLLSNHRIYIKDVNGNNNAPTGGIDLKKGSGAAFSLGIKGKTLYLKDANGNEISGSSITLP